MFFVLDRNALGPITRHNQIVRVAHNTYWGPADLGNELTSYEGYGPLTNQNLWPHIHGSPVYWGDNNGGRIYVAAERDYLRGYWWLPHTATLATPAFAVATKRERPNNFDDRKPTMPSGILSVSGNPPAHQAPILWMTQPLQAQKDPARNSPPHMEKVDGILRAYDGYSLRELWNSGNVPPNTLAPSAPLAADFLGSIAKFCPPTIANGHVYVATFDGKVQVYGLKTASRVRPIAHGPDFDGDGQPDVVWRHKSTQWNSFWPLKPVVAGPNTYGPYAYPSFDSEGLEDGWDIVATGDFDGDGQTDLVWRNEATGENSVWILDRFDPEKNVAHTKHFAQLPPVSDKNWRIAATGDFNGDGQTDLVWRNTATGDNSVWILGAYVEAKNAVPVVVYATVQHQDPTAGWDLVSSTAINEEDLLGAASSGHV